MKKKSVRVYFMGLRLNNDEKLCPHFIDDKGEIHIFAKVRAWGIGAAFEMTAEKGGNYVMSTRPKPVDESIHENADQWQAEEWADRREYQRMQAAKRVANMKDLMQDVPALKRRLASVLNQTQVVHAIIETLVEELCREAREKERREFNEKIRRIAKKINLK